MSTNEDAADRVLSDPSSSDDAKECARELKKWTQWARQIRDRGIRAAEERGE